VYYGDAVQVETSVTAHGNPQIQSNEHFAFVSRGVAREKWIPPYFNLMINGYFS
jgi:hypothetical protein